MDFRGDSPAPPVWLGRRKLFEFATTGLFSTAVLDLLNDNLPADDRESSAFPQFPAKAKHVIHMTLVGGYSQVDSFDYKPELAKLHGKEIPGGQKPDTFFGSAGLIHQNHWSFKRRGQSGIWISEMFPHLADLADELTIINSMVSETANHTPATFQQLTGFQANGFPTMGSWLSYGLGNVSDSLPTFVVLPDQRSLPSGGAANWQNGFLPAEHQGTLFRNGEVPIRDLFPQRSIDPRKEADARRLLQSLNAQHLENHPEDPILKARVQAFELAAKMQLSVPGVTRFDNETKATQDLYGIGNPATDDCGRRCLLARRLVERGVRYVHVYSGGSFGGKPRHGWDSHENCRVDHAREAKRIDQPIAALIKDLKRTGLLEETIVLFTTEFGRTPFANAPQGKIGLGRDHNPEGFTCWLAGGGAKPGLIYGKTDEIGWKSVEQKVHWHDFHATVLHLLGIDHERLTFYHNGIERRLTNVHGHVIRDLLA